MQPYKQQRIEQAEMPKQQYWLLVIGVIIIAANLRAPITAVGPLIPSFRDDLGLSNAIAGSITTLPLLAFAFLSPFAPKIARKIGTEAIILAALLMLTAGIAIRSVPNVSLLFIGTILIGLAIAIGNVLLPALIKHHFPLKIGLMTGMYAVFMNVFGALASGFSVPLSHIGNLNWRGALGFWIIPAVIAIIIWAFHMSKKGEKMEHRTVKGFQSLNMWKSLLAWKVTIFMGMQSLMFYTLMTWLPEILQNHGYSQSTSGWMLSLLQFAIIPMTFIIPILAVKFTNQKMLAIITAALFFIGILGLMQGSLIPFWIIIIGIGSGSAFGLSMIFFSLRTSNSAQSSELSGMAQSFGYLMAAVGPVLFGFLQETTGGWQVSLIWLLAGAVVLLIAGVGAGKGTIAD